MKEKQEDPLDHLLNVMGSKDKESNRATLQKIMGELSEFYDNLTLVLKYGTAWQKKLALNCFKNLQQGMKGKLETFCQKEGLNAKELEKILKGSIMQSSPQVLAAKEKIAAMEAKVEAVVKPRKKPVKKKSSNRAQKRKMEKHIRAKL